MTTPPTVLMEGASQGIDQGPKGKILPGTNSLDMLELTSEQRVVLDPCSWETYERILAEHADRSVPRFTYCDGVLEIMSPSPEHEEMNEGVKQIIWVLCEELDLEVRPLGSTTQRRETLGRGVEPDSSYFFGDTEREPLDCPPDLMVEVEISRSALDKVPVLAGLGVPELWRCGPEGCQIFLLRGQTYEAADRSAFVPLTAADLSHFLARRRQLKQNAWLNELRTWARAKVKC